VFFAKKISSIQLSLRPLRLCESLLYSLFDLATPGCTDKKSWSVFDLIGHALSA
jgi:hypothetical protein